MFGSRSVLHGVRRFLKLNQLSSNLVQCGLPRQSLLRIGGALHRFLQEGLLFAQRICASPFCSAWLEERFREADASPALSASFAFAGSSEGVVQEQQQGPEEWRTFKTFSPLSLAEESEMNRFRETASEPLLSVLDGGHVDASVVDTVLRLLCPPTAQVFPSAPVGSFWIFPFVSGFQWRLIYASRETGTVELLDPMLGTGAAKTGPALARYVAGLLTGGDWSVLLPNAFDATGSLPRSHAALKFGQATLVSINLRQGGSRWPAAGTDLTARNLAAALWSIGNSLEPKSCGCPLVTM